MVRDEEFGCFLAEVGGRILGGIVVAGDAAKAWRAMVVVSVREGKTETGFIDHEELEGREDRVIALNKSGEGPASNTVMVVL